MNKNIVDTTRVDVVATQESEEQEQGGGALARVEAAEAVARVQSAYVMARKFPRHKERAIADIVAECARKELADVAIYRFPRGGETVQGPSIRLAEVIAQNWGNVDFGVREIEHVEGLNGRSVIEAYCLDLEKNVQKTSTFTVFHKRKVGKGNASKMRHLDDPRDVYEHVANMGTRRMRECILKVIPKHVTDRALAAVRATRDAEKSTRPFQDRVQDMVVAFKELGVTTEMLEGWLEHSISMLNEDELEELRGIFTAIKQKHADRGEYFDLRSPADGGKAGLLNARAKTPEEIAAEAVDRG